MFNKRTLLLLFLLLIAIGTVSSVCAEELSDDAVGNSSFDKIKVSDNNDVIGETSNQDSLQMDDGGSYDDDSYDDDYYDDDSYDDDSYDDYYDDDWEDSDSYDEYYDDDSFSALKGIIDSASDGSTVTLDSDYYYNYNCDDEGGIEINKVLTINGNGHTIDCAQGARAFRILSDGVVINDLTFVNAVDTCLILYNNLTTINNCNFSYNTGNTGGAIACAGKLVVNDCYFNDNHATKHGGAIYAFYPFVGRDSLVISDSTFDWNWAEEYGGAIYLQYYNSAGVIRSNMPAKDYFKNTTFIQNEASYGGAIFNQHYVDIEDCDFLYNHVYAGGGAIYMSSGALFYGQDGKPIIDYPFGLEIYGNSTFIDNYAEYYGGAIRVSTSEDHEKEGIKGRVYVYDNVLFELNSAGTGGALSLLNVESSIENAKFINNSADEGSAMYGGTAVNCIFEGNSGSATYDTEVINECNGKLTLKQSGLYYKDKSITVTLTNADTGDALTKKDVVVKFSNGKSVTLTTNSNGVATYKLPYNPGTYTATATVKDESINVSSTTLTGIKISKTPITITPTKLSTTYASGKYFQVKVVNSKTKKAVSGAKLKLKVYTSKKYKTVTVTTNSKGIAKYNTAKLALGTHKVIVTNGQTNYFTGAKKTSSIKISKATYKISAPKVTNVYKKAGKFKVTVKNKGSGKAVKNAKVVIKVYTGKKYKTFTVKTNSKGVASISTKSLTKTTHKVVISVKGTSNFKAGSAKSSIKITKSKIATTLADEAPSTFDFAKFATDNFQHVFYDDGSLRGYAAKLTLRDANGKELFKTIDVYYGSNYVTSGKSGEFFFIPKKGLGTFKFVFAGDSVYKGSSCEKDINLLLA